MPDYKYIVWVGGIPDYYVEQTKPNHITMNG